MKKLIAIAIAFIALQGIAQDKKEYANRIEKGHRITKLTPEEAATLKTKHMTLRYDLTASQQNEVYKINLENAKARKEMMEAFKTKKESGEWQRPTKEERLKMINARLDHKIAVKAKMKSILNDEQYTKWQEAQANMQHRAHKMKKDMPKKRFEGKINRK